jgi:predicted ATP-binding protein involved in virulence
MELEKITIQNFRNIENETTFDLNPKFTAIIGINGKGKSTLLHAIRIASGSYLLGIPEAPKRHIWPNEIRIKDYQSHLSLITPTIVQDEGSIDGQRLNSPWRRQIPEGKTKTTSNYEDVGEIRSIARRKYDLITKEGNSDIDNPVIAFFGTNRLFGSSRNTLGTFIGRQIFKYGYYNWFDMCYDTYQYTYWLNSHRFLVEDKKESDATYYAFMDAVKKANPYITALDFDGKELRLKVQLGENEPESPFLPLSLHSDGVITHTAMAAELAFRCIMLNAHHKRNAVNKSRGIVMIDEIDLHLHPNWQRHVITDLKNAFPNIQFIVTTHSPFIVQSLDSQELINLDTDSDVSPKDLSIDIVSHEIMGVDSNYSVENEKKETESSDYLTLLEEADKSSTPSDYLTRLQTMEDNISDPALRAFLRMNRVAKNII